MIITSKRSSFLIGMLTGVAGAAFILVGRPFVGLSESGPGTGNPTAALRTLSAEDASTVQKYLAENKARKLQLGAGPYNLPGWLNTDIEPRSGQVFLDASEPFPLPDGSFQYVFAEQLIEHLEYREAVAMLKECHRILSPGGRLRIATPNLARAIELFDKERTPEQDYWVRFHQRVDRLPATVTAGCAMTNLFCRGWGHRFVYDLSSLEATLKSAGFREVSQHSLGESDDDALRGVDMHWRSGSRQLDSFETMFVQAVRSE